MLLTGTYPRVLDEKQRLALPRPIRDALGNSLTALYAAPGTDGTVSLYTEEVFRQLAQHFESLPPTAEEIRSFSRLFYAQAHRLELDRQGRVRIPAELARLAGLDRELVLLGVRDHLELWNKVRWEEYLAEQQSRYDQIAERAFSYRPGEVPASAPGAAQSAAPESSQVRRTARKPR
ncbi:MAG: transcriptional regulator MraZ [Pirellulaceae bacterium]|nr:MAG: transcriptional regulator MraZ [Pirellulaceae bacterium]